MNKIKYILLFMFVGLMGCESYFLDKEPLGIISDGVVWEDPALINAYLADLYRRVDFIELRGNVGEQTSHAMIASMGGEGRSFGGHHQSYIASTNVITSSGTNEELDYWKYQNIRDCNYFIEKIEESALAQELVDQRISEVRFLRAYMYFQKVIRFGGVPLMTVVQTIDTPQDELYVKRNSEKEIYDFIISEMNAISQILPSVYPESDKGRPSKWAAIALKSRAALYAASIAKYGQVQLGGLLGFPASDVENYAQISYDASNAIINNGVHSLYEVLPDPTENFQNLFLDESAANTEVIMSEVYDYSKNRAHSYTHRATPHDFSNSWASMLVLFDFTERFEFADGTPGTSISRAQLTSQEWSPDELWHNRDPRFRASVFYPESPWQGGNVLFHKKTIRGGVTYTSGVAEDGWPYAAHRRNWLRTGLMPRKRCNESLTPEPLQNDETDYIIFRIGEIYLNLAEAALYLNKDGEALTALNRLRERAAMPPKPAIDEAIIQNERLVELTWENQSYWDLRRWRIAKEELDGVRMKGCEYTYNYDTKKYKIVLKNAEGVARTFLDHNYYLPLGVNRVSENPNFVENPGY
jgi:hypothetical protein